MTKDKKVTLKDYSNCKHCNNAFSLMLKGFIGIMLIHVIAYFVLLKKIPAFLTYYGWWLLYLDVSIAVIAGAIWYYASHKGYVSCMASMMIGMTLGMQSGMMIGAVFGAVNGYFIGAMIGMLLGTLIGFLTGRDSLMGVLQGAMSGVMGGTMGAMITVMMFTDRVLYFMPLYMLINVAILIGFIYMYHDEVIKDNKELIEKHVSTTVFMSACILTALILSAIMVYAPKSLLFGGA